jgi:hypothetical protein
VGHATSLTVDRTTRPDGVTSIRLTGTIDERSELITLFKSLSGPVSFNLSGIERINSIGILHWITNFAEYTHRFPTTVEQVSYPFAIQANAIANLFGRATIESCLAPYFCSRCGQSRMSLVAHDDLQASKGQPPERRCPSCDAVMAFDDLDTYFHFLHR